MSYNPDQLIKIVANYEQLATESLVATAKKKEKRKLDPKAKVRTRGTVVFPAESSSVKDKKDHFPINDADQARNALARSHQYNKAPPWYKGSLKSLQEAVARKVKSKYPKIDVGGKEKKSSLEFDLVSLAQNFGDMSGRQLAEYAYNHQMMPPPIGAGGKADAGKAWLDALLTGQKISQALYNDALTQLRMMLTTKHPRKASLEYIDSLLAKYGTSDFLE